MMVYNSLLTTIIDEANSCVGKHSYVETVSPRLCSVTSGIQQPALNSLFSQVHKTIDVWGVYTVVKHANSGAKGKLPDA